MKFSPTETKIAKRLQLEITTRVVKMKAILIEKGEITKKTIWTKAAIKSQVWEDFIAKEKFAKMIKGLAAMFDEGRVEEADALIKRCVKEMDSKDGKKNLEGYIQGLLKIESGMKKLGLTDVKAAKKFVETQMAIEQKDSKKPTKTLSTKQKKRQVAQKLKEFHHRWQNASRSDWEKRYRVTYQAMLKMSPKWKYDVIKRDPDDKLSVELSKRVVSTVDNSHEFAKFIQEAASSKQLTPELEGLEVGLCRLLGIANVFKAGEEFEASKPSPNDQNTFDEW